MKVKSLLKDEIEVKINEDLNGNYYWTVENSEVFGLERTYSINDYATRPTAKRAFKTFAKRNGWKNYKFV